MGIRGGFPGCVGFTDQQIPLPLLGGLMAFIINNHRRQVTRIKVISRHPAKGAFIVVDMIVIVITQLVDPQIIRVNGPQRAASCRGGCDCYGKSGGHINHQEMHSAAAVNTARHIAAGSCAAGTPQTASVPVQYPLWIFRKNNI
ncbi:hypothetical protein VQ7734_05098 [Vibrio quintilis]|uniref:Uncharacterized protein n=1 Tax=Vibrio quintilis TaxID=1117707 RepID=A0A1M7Z3A4_9VIBR|nr:hypothetical protein VQ7734_05098 [Vibrio quintilis]